MDQRRSQRRWLCRPIAGRLEAPPVMTPRGVNGFDFVRRDVGKRAEDRIADLVKKAMQNKISADSNRADFALAA
jgi:hypothetical protein